MTCIISFFDLEKKFFPPDPGEQLHDEYTRYLFVLAIKRDIRQANISCAESMIAVLASCLVQSEFGDFDQEECSNIEYIKKLDLLPNPSVDLLTRIRDLHRQRVGQKDSCFLICFGCKK